MTITADIVTETLHRIVAEKGPDYVYPKALNGESCTYSEPDGAPSCGVGYVIAALAPEHFKQINQAEYRHENDPDYVEVESFGVSDAFEGGYVVDIDEEDIAKYGEAIPVEDKADITRGLQLFQKAQDAGMTWGESQEYYDRYMADPTSETYTSLYQELTDKGMKLVEAREKAEWEAAQEAAKNDD